MTMIMYRNFNNDESCISLLQRMSNVEYLTLLLLATDKDSIRPTHFIDEPILEKIVQYMPHLRQFNYHIRSILKNASLITIDQICQSFPKHLHVTKKPKKFHLNDDF